MNGPSTAMFQLQPRSGEHSESIFLRHGDVLRFPTSKSRLTCQWTDSEVQVNSSAAANIIGVVETLEDDNEDENTIEPTIGTVSLNQKQPQPQPRATPRLSNQRSVTIVQETPTTSRIEHVLDSCEADVKPPDFLSDVDKPVEDVPTFSRDLEPERGPEQEAEAFSTASTGESQGHAHSKVSSNARVSSPRVQIPARLSKKRALPTVEEQAPKSDNKALAGPSKRAKTSDSDTDDSRLSNVDIATADVSSMLPRSQRNLQRSTAITTEDYNCPTPRIACSNSTIVKTSQAVKFLKKQGGAYVENLSDDFNVLW
jgi:hypothetical protein